MKSRLATSAAKTFTKQRVAIVGRTLVPFLVALAVSPIAAHAQGTVDLTGVTTAMSSVEKTCMLGGAIAVVIGIVFGVFQFMGRNIARRIYVHRWRPVCRHRHWLCPSMGRSLTGQTVSMVVTHVCGRGGLTMHMTKRGEPLPINQALNKPREKLGLSLPIWMGIVIVSILVLLLRFYLLSLAIFIVITGACWLIVRKHPKMFQLWGLSFTQKSYYDPRKR